jgi:hypothetical protein
MLIDLISAEYRGDYKIELVFEDGKRDIVDFSSYINKPGIFSKFRDIDYFRNFTVDPEVKTLTWSNEIDIAPEILYSKATNSPLPEWMRKLS